MANVQATEPAEAIRERLSALLKEIDKAQRAAVALDVTALDVAVGEHLRLSRELDAILKNDGARELLRPLQPALRRYSLLLKGSERLVNTITRVMNSGGISPACES